MAQRKSAYVDGDAFVFERRMYEPLEMLPGFSSEDREIVDDFIGSFDGVGVVWNIEVHERQRILVRLDERVEILEPRSRRIPEALDRRGRVIAEREICQGRVPQGDSLFHILEESLVVLGVAPYESRRGILCSHW